MSWKEQCADCANLKISREGRIWKCKAVRAGATIVYIGHIVYATEARAPGAKCGPQALLFKPFVPPPPIRPSSADGGVKEVPHG